MNVVNEVFLSLKLLFIEVPIFSDCLEFHIKYHVYVRWRLDFIVL